VYVCKCIWFVCESSVCERVKEIECTCACRAQGPASGEVQALRAREQLLLDRLVAQSEAAQRKQGQLQEEVAALKQREKELEGRRAEISEDLRKLLESQAPAVPPPYWQARSLSSDVPCELVEVKGLVQHVQAIMPKTCQVLHVHRYPCACSVGWNLLGICLESAWLDHAA
jgi:hypothetical protein